MSGGEVFWERGRPVEEWESKGTSSVVVVGSS